MVFNSLLMNFIEFTTTEYAIIIFIQIFLLGLFVSMVSYFCKLLRKKSEGRSTKKTCIIIWLLSGVAWFIIAQIVWVITSSQYAGI